MIQAFHYQSNIVNTTLLRGYQNNIYLEGSYQNRKSYNLQVFNKIALAKLFTITKKISMVKSFFVKFQTVDRQIH